MEHNLPTPPQEELSKSHGPRKPHGVSKVVKNVHRGSKRPSTHSHPSPTSHQHDAHILDGRHKRVWKACERCRMKKTKCDGEFPCKRCKDDGLVCTAGTRKKTEFKQLPKGYAEVLENTQFALIATVHKLYNMVRNQQQWDLGEPELNDRGQPVIHNIAQRLGCIRPNNDIDLPVHNIFPEDEQGLAELAATLEAQQQETSSQAASISSVKMESEASYQRSDRASSSELDHSDFEADYRKSVFGRNNGVTLSPQSLTYNEFDVPSTTAETFAQPSPAIADQHSFPQWVSRPASMEIGPQFISPAGNFMNMDLLNQGLVESSFGTIKPHMLSCPNPEVMMGMGDPMMYSGGYDNDACRI